MKLSVTNPDLSQEERTSLTSDYSSGTTLTVANNEGFTDDWYVVVGEPGQEQTETAAIDSISGNTTITLAAALKFDHSKSTPVYLSHWNQISMEQKTAGGSYAVIAEGLKNIEWDDANKKSLVIVAAGISTDTFKWRFYNSTLTTYSDYSGELAGTGIGRDSVGYVIEQVKKNSVAKTVEDETILDYCNDFQDVVYEEMPTAWWFTKEGTAVSTAENDYDYPISTNWSDLLSIKYLIYRYINGSTDITYPLTWSPPAEMRNYKSDANQASDDYAKWWSFYPPDSSSAKGYIVLHPTPKTDDSYIQPVYYFELTALDSFDDTLVIPSAKGYIDYVLYRIYDDIKSDTTNADKYNFRVGRSLTALRRRKSRQKGQPELFRFRGHRGWSRLFGEQSRLSSSENRELYW